MIWVVLCAALLILSLSACSGSKSVLSEPELPKEFSELGTGDNTIEVYVTFADQKIKAYKIHTDKETVGDALADIGFIAGEPGPYGLYVKTVDGVTLDFNKDNKYWAFYENGKYASQGVNLTKISEDAKYEFRAE